MELYLYFWTESSSNSIPQQQKCYQAIMDTYFQCKKQYQWRKIMQEFQPSGAISEAPLYYQSWSSLLLIAKFWNISVIPHHGRVQTIFVISEKNWIMFPSDHIITINNYFCSLNTMEPFHCYHCWLLHFEVILLFFLKISL